MEILYLLVPLAVVIAVGIVWTLLWAIKSGQFDDLERPRHEIFWDDREDHRPADSDVNAAKTPKSKRRS